MAEYTQEGRPIAVKTPLGEDTLLLEAVAGTEEMSRLFRFDLDMLSVEESIDPTEIVGKQVSFRINRADDSPRWFSGWVSRFSWVGRDERLTRWRAEVVPSLWFLTRTSDCKAWAEKRLEVPKIVEEVLREQSRVTLKNSLHGAYATWEYCVQYRETDFNFVSRLMEQEGIAYHFVHGEDRLEVVLADSASAYTACEDGEVEFVDDFADPTKPGQMERWHREWCFTTGKFSQRDFNYETPTTDLLSQQNGKAEYEGASDLETFDYPGEFESKGDGDADTRLRIEAEEVNGSVAHGTSTCRTFSPGFTFKAPDGERYLLTFVSHSASIRGAYQSGGRAAFNYQNVFRCIPADVPFRPQRITPKPIVGGAQTALVVGKSGEEIDTDKYGRVKVQFHWDRYGKKNEKSSCWVRVAQAMAGPGWGGQFIPRIGQEVIVSFLEGDPDRPLVTGVVYNDQQKPPFALPDNKTQSGFRSRSTKQAGDTNFNELRFEDKKGSEEISIRAERDFRRVVENNDILEVGASKKDDGDRTVTVFNSHVETVGCSEAKEGSRTLTVWKDDTTTIKTGDQSAIVEKGDSSVEVKLGDRTIRVAMGKQSTEAMQSIELKVGGNSIKVDQTGVSIKGLMVKIEGEITTEVKAGAMATLDGGGMLQAKAGITMIG